MNLLVIILMSLFQDAAVNDKGLFVPIPQEAKISREQLLKLRPVLDFRQQAGTAIAEVLIDDDALWHWQRMIQADMATILATPTHHTPDGWYKQRYFILKLQFLKMDRYKVWRGLPPKGWKSWAQARGKIQSRPMRGWVFGKSRSAHLEATFLARVRAEHIAQLERSRKTMLFWSQKWAGRRAELIVLVVHLRDERDLACRREPKLVDGKKRLIYVDWEGCRRALSEYGTWKNTLDSHLTVGKTGLKARMADELAIIKFHQDQLSGLDTADMKVVRK